MGNVADKLAPIAFHLLEFLDFVLQRLPRAVDVPQKRAEFVRRTIGGGRQVVELVGTDLTNDRLEVAEAVMHPDVNRGVGGSGHAQSQEHGGPHCREEQAPPDAGSQSRRASDLEGQATHKRRERIEQRHGAVQPAQNTMRTSGSRTFRTGPDVPGRAGRSH